jgi:hypothetical protein
VTMRRYTNSDIYCEFQRTPTLVSEDMDVQFDLANDKYYLLTARGKMTGKHFESPANARIFDIIVYMGFLTSRRTHFVSLPERDFSSNCGFNWNAADHRSGKNFNNLANI